jgi:hypothetical protein
MPGWIILATWLVVAAPQPSATEYHGACNSDFFRLSWSLLRDADWGTSSLEKAAFVVREPDGRIDFIRWTGSGDRSADYYGEVPPNAVAIVHTHPNSQPLPSWRDTQVARRLAMPVYVVTRAHLFATSAGRTRIKLASGDWNPERCKIAK